jgi:hypothetical protein
MKGRLKKELVNNGADTFFRSRSVGATAFYRKDGGMRINLFQIVPLFVLQLVAGVLISTSVAAAPESLCEIFSKLLQPPSQTGLDRYQLSSTYGQGVEHFMNLDIDGDDIGDLVEKGCPGSNVPSDPCMLSIKLSSSGETLVFEAWGFRLFRYHAQIYIAANVDEARKKKNIYKIDKSGFELVCAKL